VGFRRAAFTPGTRRVRTPLARGPGAPENPQLGLSKWRGTAESYWFAMTWHDLQLLDEMASDR